MTSLRHRQGKPRLTSWIKFREVVEREFVPYNYDSIVYQQLHNLRQGVRSVDDYTQDFYRLLTRVEISEPRHQIVARYVSGLRANIRETLNLFRPDTVSDAHQRAVLIKLQQGPKAGPTFGSSSRQQMRSLPASQPIPTHGAVASRFPTGAGTSSQGGGSAGQPPSTNLPRAVAGLRCFACGEMGHRQSACPKGTGSRALFTEEGGEYETLVDYEGAP
ncbi:F-box associated ubiquitination effector family protein, partial [Striga hermonthica]